MKTLLTKIDIATRKDSWPLIWQIIVLLLMIITFQVAICNAEEKDVQIELWNLSGISIFLCQAELIFNIIFWNFIHYDTIDHRYMSIDPQNNWPCCTSQPLLYYIDHSIPFRIDILLCCFRHRKYSSNLIQERRVNYHSLLSLQVGFLVLFDSPGALHTWVKRLMSHGKHGLRYIDYERWNAVFVRR